MQVYVYTFTNALEFPLVPGPVWMDLLGSLHEAFLSPPSPGSEVKKLLKGGLVSTTEYDFS